jgi:hypothetical protein
MVISIRDLITIVHGLGFGVLFMLAFSGAIGVIYASTATGELWPSSSAQHKMFRFYLISMAVLSWLAVLSGTYIIYPWYRAVPPAGTTDLSAYPKQLLLSDPMTAGWHDFGMEWKEHVSWLAPIAMTMVAFVFIKYGPQLARHRQSAPQCWASPLSPSWRPSCLASLARCSTHTRRYGVALRSS